MRETQPPKLLFYLRTGLLVTPRFYLSFPGLSNLMQREVLRWHRACRFGFKRQLQVPLSHLPYTDCKRVQTNVPGIH
jgi:hypothetical protein